MEEVSFSVRVLRLNRNVRTQIAVPEFKLYFSFIFLFLFYIYVYIFFRKSVINFCL